MQASKSQKYLLPLTIATLSAFATSTTLATGNAASALEIRDERLKEKLEALPPHAREKALEKLRAFKIPAEDHKFIDLDATGEVLYADPRNPGDHAIEHTDAETQTTDDQTSIQTIDAVQAFTLHSNPGAPNTLIVDFDGHTLSNTAWNGSYNTLQAAPFDLDGNLSAWSEKELTAIAHIWHRIAEDFAGFDVNVTTEEPSQLNSNTGRILITKNVDTTSKSMPYSSAGGVAYVGVWGYSNFHTYYSPALVYYNNLGGNTHNIAEAASHEAGHNLGLSHDGTTNGTSYYGGHGSGNTDWGPIMGVGYYGQVTQWSKGDYDYANNTQDDIAIIKNRLSLRADDHGNTPSSATLLHINNDGSISASTPETDPYNLNTDNKGIIEQINDVDIFMLNVDAGELSLTITPAWAAFHVSGKRGSNLDAKARLLTQSGKVIARSNQPDDTFAALSATVSAGTYYLEVSNESTGDPTTGYDDYGSLGHYYITGSAVPGDGGTGDNAPNEPPIAQNDSYTVAEDSVTSLDVLANDSDPEQTSLTILSFTQPNNGNLDLNNGQLVYTPNANFNGVSAFSYTVMDAAGSTDTASVSLTVTAVNDAPVANSDSASTEMGSAASINILSNDSDVDGDALSATVAAAPSNGSVTISGNTATYTPDTNFIGTDSFTYRLTDGAGGSSSATVTIAVTEKLAPPTTPSSFSAADNGSGIAKMTWADTDNEANYEIQREYYKTKGKSGWTGTTFLSTSENTVQLQDNLGNNGTYRYRIRSNNALGSSAWSSWQRVEMTSADSSGGGNGGGNGGGKGRNK